MLMGGNCCRPAKSTEGTGEGEDRQTEIEGATIGKLDGRRNSRNSERKVRRVVVGLTFFSRRVLGEQDEPGGEI